MKKTVLWLLIIMVVAFALAGTTYKITGAASPAGPSLVEVDEEQKLDVEGVRDILAKTVEFDIRIIPVDGDIARVHFHGKAWSKREDSPWIETRKDGDRLEVKIADLKNDCRINLSLFRPNVAQEGSLDVYLPKRYQGDLKTETVSGALQLSGFNLAGLNCRSISGDILLEQLRSEQADVETTSGEAVLRGCSGNFNLKSVSGDIENESFSGRANLKTISGDIGISVEKEIYHIAMETTSGDARISLPKDAKFGLRFETVSGDYHSDFPIQLSEMGNNRRLEGSVGESSNRIEVRTISGDLKIEENE
jgi:DUF4097 and DUF4098 domain-containing protein YvlB